MFLVRSSRADAGVHSSSDALMHLMWNGRLGRSLPFALTRISFWLSLSLCQTRALASSYPGGTGMPNEVKKELWTSEWVLFLLLPEAQSCVGVRV